MDRLQQAKIDELFLAAVQLSSTEREQFLESECAGLEPAVRTEVEQLLAGDLAADQAGLTNLPLRVEYATPAETANRSQTGSEPGDAKRVGNYRLLRRIGEGGMGVVYLADQLQPVRRQVALKLIKPGMQSKQVIARFEAERQAVALMDHPNIAKVLDASTTEDGRPYFVMELVQGTPITKYADDNRLSLRERLHLFIPVCQAVQHAHQKGIIHRDLKPSNVLVATYAGQPAPKVIDFGIAKATAQSLTDKTLFTHFGQFVGTLEYMSPEQGGGESLDVDTRSDVYSLGILLYELITGFTPFDRDRMRNVAIDEVMKLIRDVEPPAPSLRLSGVFADRKEAAREVAAKRQLEPNRIATAVKGELDWIVMHALEKDRARRYETADAFAADIQRYLNDEPVVASPPSASYRLRKTLKRNRNLVLAAALIFSALLLGIIGTSLQWLRSNHLTQQLQKSAYISNMQIANQAHVVGDMTRVRELLELHRPRAGGIDHRGFEWYYLSNLAREIESVPTWKGDRAIASLAWQAIETGHPKLAVFHDQKRTLLPLDFEYGTTPEFQAPVAYSDEWYWMPCIASDALGKQFITLENLVSPTGDLQIVLTLSDSLTGKTILKQEIPEQLLKGDSPRRDVDLRATSVAISNEGNRILTGHWDGTVSGWSRSSGRIVKQFSERLHSRTIADLEFHPGSDSIVTASWDATAKLVDFESGKPQATFSHGSELNDICLSSDGTRLFSTTQLGRLYITDVSTRKSHIVDQGLILFALAVSPDDSMVAVGGEDGVIRVCDAKTGLLLKRLRGHMGGLRELIFSPDSSWLMSGGDYGEVRRWLIGDALAVRSNGFLRRASSLPTESIIEMATKETFDLAFHPNQPLLALGSQDQVRLWDLEKQEFAGTLRAGAQVRSVTFSKDGNQMIVGTLAKEGDGIAIYDMQGKVVAQQPQSTQVGNVAMLSPDGQRMILSRDVGAKTSDLTVTDVTSGEVLIEVPTDSQFQNGYGVDRSAISHDNALFAAFAHSRHNDEYVGVIRAWSLQTQKQLWTVNAHKKPIHSLAFSPDGQLLVSTSDDHFIRFWNPQNGQLLKTLKGHRSWVMESVFTHDGNTLITASVDGTVRLWDVDSGDERFVFQGDGSPFICVAINADGDMIAAGNRRGKVWIWHVNRN